MCYDKVRDVHNTIPETGCICEGSSNDTKAVAIQHDSNELYDQRKHHLLYIVCTNVAIAYGCESGRGPVERCDVILDGGGRAAGRYAMSSGPTGTRAPEGEGRAGKTYMYIHMHKKEETTHTYSVSSRQGETRYRH